MDSGDIPEGLPTTDQPIGGIFSKLINLNLRLSRLKSLDSTSLPPSQNPTVTDSLQRVAQTGKALEAAKKPRHLDKGKTPGKRVPPNKGSAIHITVDEENKDPEQHLSMFTKAMELGRVDKSFYVPVFFHTLGTSAQDWYSQLDPQQVQEWDHFSQLFRAQYATKVTTPVTLEQLQFIKQKEGEASASKSVATEGSVQPTRQSDTPIKGPAEAIHTLGNVLHRGSRQILEPRHY